MDIIIPAYNGVDITARLLSSLKLFAPEYPIILVDNGSQEDMRPLRALLAEQDTFVQLDVNVGPYGAVNHAIRLSSAEKIAIVCNDVVVMPGTMQILDHRLHASTGVCAVGAQDVIRPHFDWYEMNAVITLAGLREKEMLVRARGHFTCFAAYRELFEADKVGPFDDKFRVTFGDTDWETRYRESGFQFYQAMNAPIFHGHSVTRKRLGLEVDITNDQADHEYFHQKWSHRPDIQAEHPLTSSERRRTDTKASFTQGEQ